jgi:protein-disulfide isomerase
MAQHQRRPNEVRAQQNTGSGFKWILIAVAVLGVIGIGYSIWSSRAGGAATGPVSIENVDPAAVAEQATPMRKGSSTATVEIVEFADFQCPGCAHFATNVGRPLRSAYVDSGRVRMTYYDYPIVSAHAHAFLAARAARCAGDQDLFWEMHDVLYARQREWSLDRTPPVERYTGYATSVGANEQEFRDCLESDRHADVVTANAMLGEQLGVRSTPTVFVNGRNVGDAWSDFAAMRRLIDQALAMAPSAGSSADTATDTSTAEAAVTR